VVWWCTANSTQVELPVQVCVGAVSRTRFVMDSRWRLNQPIQRPNGGRQDGVPAGFGYSLDRVYERTVGQVFGYLDLSQVASGLPIK
jgi:hypothetical protein